MGRWNPVVVAFVAIALAASYGASVLSAAAGLNSLVAPVALVVLVGAFGWTRRDRDVLDVFVPSFFIAYAGYLGIALARVPHTSVAASIDWGLGPLAKLGPLSDKWPLVLVGGVIAALILAIIVAVPVSMIPVRRHVDPHASDALWAVVEESNARTAVERQAAPPDPGKPRP